MFGRKVLKKGEAKPGFTLIELLMVISIMAILALLAVNSYTGVQRQAAVDFAADTVVSRIREAEDLARSGRREEDQAICYAVKLEEGVDGGLFTAQTPYIAVENDVVDSCRTVSEGGWRKSDIFNDRIVVISAGNTGGVSGESPLIYYFKPPFGRIFQENGGELISTAGQTIDIVVGDPDFSVWNRTVRFDLSTGEVKKVVTAI